MFPKPEPGSHNPQSGRSPENNLSALHGPTVGYDPIRERNESLSQPVTPGAVCFAPVLSLSELRQVIAEHPTAAIVISDLHGYVELLQHVLGELGLLRGGGAQRTNKVISIGDLVDGRHHDDAATLQFAQAHLDLIVAGNHEVAIMGGPGFVGQPAVANDEVGERLWEFARNRVLVGACAIHGVLVTHAGVNSCYAKDSAEASAEFINLQWREFISGNVLRSRMLRTPAALLSPSPDRSGGRLKPGGDHPAPGCLWQSWRELIRDHPKGFRQLVGHSARGRIEQTVDKACLNIDTAGYRLGIAVVTDSGDVSCGSDFL